MNEINICREKVVKAANDVFKLTAPFIEDTLRNYDLNDSELYSAVVNVINLLYVTIIETERERRKISIDETLKSHEFYIREHIKENSKMENLA